MFVKFQNGDVPIYKLRKGVVVEYEGDFYHIEHVYRTKDSRIRLTINGAFELHEVGPQFVDWLEPM